MLQLRPSEVDPFGLKKLDLSTRVPEISEMFTPEEAKLYTDGCDYPDSADDLLLAWELDRQFGPLTDKHILDAMCGPGRLGRELLNLGTRHVIFHDGDRMMTTHARKEASKIIQTWQQMHDVTLPVDKIFLPENIFDLVVCHNAIHQLSSLEKLGKVMEGFLRLTVPGGRIMIADYQRDTSPEFLKALEERLMWTKPEIIPFLIPTFQAAFSKEEFESILRSMPGIKSWSVTDAQPPVLTPEMQKRTEADPIKGHLMDYSPLSLRVIVEKEEI